MLVTLALAATVVSMALALEVELRARAAHERAAGSVPADLAPRGLYRESADPALRYELIPEARVVAETGARIEINGAGFRGPLPAVPKPRGTRRVIVLGDSEVFGAKLGEADTLPAQLERALNARRGAGWDVLNFGVEGYDTLQETRLFETRGVALEPDVVVLYFVSNDVLPPELVRVADGWDRSFLVRWGRDLVLMQRARRLLGTGNDYRDYVRHAYDPGSRVWLLGRERVRALAERVAAAHARFLVVVAPEIFGIERREELLDTPYRAFHRALARLAEDGIEVVDPLPALVDCAARPTDLWVTPTDHHKNGRANRCIAEQVVTAGALAMDTTDAAHTEGP